MNILNLNNTYECIKSAHFYNGYIKRPAAQELNQIRACVESIDWKGKTVTLCSLAGLGISYYLWQFSNPGPLLSIIVGTTSVATAILAYDMQAISENLQREYIDKFSAQSYISWQTTENLSENEFREKFKNIINPKTLLTKV